MLSKFSLVSRLLARTKGGRDGRGVVNSHHARAADLSLSLSLSSLSLPLWLSHLSNESWPPSSPFLLPPHQTLLPLPGPNPDDDDDDDDEEISSRSNVQPGLDSRSNICRCTKRERELNRHKLTFF